MGDIATAGLKIFQGIKSFQENAAMAQATKRETAVNIANQEAAFKINRERLTRQQEQSAGKQLVSAAGSGATLNSFDSLLNDNSQMSIMDQALLEYDKNLNVANTQYEGLMKKKAYYRQGRSALLSSVIDAAGGYSTSTSGSKAINSASNSLGQSVGRSVSSSPYGPQLNYGSRTLSGY